MLRALTAATLLGAALPVYGADAVRGEVLHRPCLDCHSAAIYQAPKAKIKSLAALRKEVQRWGDHYNPRLTRDEVEDIVAYLNRDFYRFP